MKTRFLKYTFLLAAFLCSVAAIAQSEISIQTQPQYESACAGSGTTFTVAAMGSNLSYQWYGHTGQSIDALNDGGIYSGTNTPTLSISEVSPEMNTRYFYCKISDGSSEIRSESATILLKNLLVNVQPQNRSVHAGDNAIFRIDASGSNIKYQWQGKENGTFTDLADGKFLTGANMPVLLIKEIELTDNNSEYRCVVTGGEECTFKSVVSESAILEVNEGLSPLKSMVQMPAETVMTMDDEIVYFRNGPEMTVWGSVVVQGESGEFGSFSETGQPKPQMEITGSLTNNNTADELFQEDDETIVTFSGSTDESILGSGLANNFHTLIINKTGGASLSLDNTPSGTINQAASVEFDLTFSAGKLNLKNNNLELLPFNSQTLALLDNTNTGVMPLIISETNDNRIIADNGEVFMEVLVGSTNPIDALNGYNLGNMGLRLEGLEDGVSQFSADNLTIRRGHNSYGINSGTIDRYFKVISGAGTPEVRMTMTYFSDELGSLDFSALDFYRNEDLNAGAEWQNQGNSDASPSIGVRTLEGELPVAGLWTLSPCNNAPDVDFPGLGEFNMCFGDSPLTLSPSISGTPVDYVWELGSYNQTTFEIDYTIISGATGSTYDVNHNNTVGGVTEFYRLTVSDASGCKGQGFASVTHIPEITVDWSNEPTVQCDLGTYFISGDWNYNNAFYTWSVDNVQQSETSSFFSFTPPAAGTYEISLTTGYFDEGVGQICPETFTHTISFNEQPLSFSFPYEFEEVRLCGDEQVTLTPENITPADDGSYTYEWFTEDDPETILSNSPTLTVGEGTPYGEEQYLLRITTAIGCSDLQLVSVFTTPVANLDWSSYPAVQCDLSPFTFDADWGNAFAGYEWSVDNVLQPSETGAQFNFTPAAAGTYEISVTTGEFAEGFICPETFTHTITFSEEPVEVSFPYPFSEVDVCEAQGSFTLTPDLTPADDGSYTYSWTLDGVEVGTDPTYTVTFDAAIESEIYQLTVTTGVGCTDNASVLVYHTESADVDWSALPESVCTLDPYTFNAGWGNAGAGFQWNVDDVIQTGQTDSTFVFTPPAAGTYTITVITGEYGSIQYCPEQFIHTITFADGEQLADLPFTMSACDVEGGLTPINLETPACTDCTYQWFDANDNPVGTNSNTYTVPDLTENTSYSVEVTKDGCTSSDEIQLFYYFATIDEAATVITNLGCDGAPTGAIDLVFDATEAGYASFSWENVNTADTYFSEDLSGLAAGTYSVTMTDDLNGCSDTATFVVGGGGETVTATSVVVQPSCFGDDNGSITLTPSGGTGTYTYTWSHGPTTIAVTDLAPDTYTVTVSDGNDCEYIESFNIIEPVVLAIDLAKADLNCAGGTDGTITVTTTGGTEPYTYVWSANANNPTDPENLTGLSAGTYTVTVTDDRDCEAITGITIEEPANAITASFAPTTQGISCNNANDGFISITASGGTGTLTYDWNANTYDGMSEVSNLPPGMYSISVSDENGCPPVVLEITFNNPAALTVSDVTVNPTAAGASDGSIDITVAGGTPDYNYDWADVPGLNNDEDRTALSAGTYTVVITDENDCEITEEYTLTEPGELSVTLESITDIPCTQAEEGAIDITVNGGVSPYTFLWSNGVETEDLTDVPAGDYTVMITDDNGIVFNSVTYTVNPPVFLTDNASLTQIDCAGETGMIVLNPTGGTSAYTYAWQHGPTTATVSDLAAGDYTVTISTANNCPFTTTYTIDAAPTAITAEFAATTSDISCNAAADGYILVNASGGTGTLTYDWNVNSLDGGNEHSNLSEGTYIVSVSDENGCPPVVLEITLNNPTVISVTEATTNPTSAGGTDGAIDLTTSGGTPNYTFDWADLAGTDDPEDRTGLPAGTYSVTITDANDCEIIEEYILTEPGQISLVLESITNISCTGTDDGAIDITISGGVAPYNVLWSNGAMTEDLSDVPAGDYTVMITDDNGIEFNSINYTVEPAVFLTDNASISQIDCADGAGTIVLNPTGGTSAYTYAWQHGPTTATVTDLAAGDYTVTISTANDCPFTATYTIDAAPTAITAAFDATSSDISCSNANDGFILINASGGTGTLTYDWNVDAYDGNNEASDLSAGDYSISISDENNCTPVVLEITIVNPEAIVASEVSINPTTAGASDGEIDITVVGGTPNYNYDWEDVAGTDNAEDRTGLAAGNYTVTITDANDCEIVEQYTLTAPGQISLIVENITNISCEGTDDGAIDITVNGGVAPYTFLWSNGDETEDLSNVSAGDYTVMITDDNGIEFNSLTYTVNPPNFLTDNAIITQIDCSDETGIIALSPTNGTGDYTYAWEHGPTTATVSDLAAGDYMVTISTDNDCPFVGTYTINAAPTEISVTGSASGVCAGNSDGTIEIDVTGGTPDYSFIWTNTADNSTVALTEDVMNLPAGDYQVEVTDDNNCVATFDFNIPEFPSLDGTANVTDVSAGSATDGAIDLTIIGGTEEFTFAWSDGDVFMADTEDISDLSVGTYTVLVTDANGCTFTASYTVNEPGALDIALNITQDIDCFGDETGQITATIGGGTEPYSYAWSNGGDTNPLIDLPAGTYTLTATDAAGIVTVSNPITIGELTEFTINAQVTNPTTAGGNDGSILTAPSGGESPYTFNWSDGTDTYSTSSLNDIGAGNYDLTVTDANGCVATDALATYTLTDPNVLAISLTASQNVSCPEGADGSLTVNASGGVEEYTYNWENAANPGTSIGATATIDALEAGTYNVTATDADGLMTSSSFDITQPDALVYNELISNVLCDNPMSGSITLAPTGGTGTYAYLWSNEATTASITDLIAGDYTVTITDENDCTYTETFSVTPASLISAEETIVDVNCNGDNTGSINLAPQGGGGTYTYLWSNEATTQNISQLTAGEYSVTISDGGECEFIETYTIDEPTALTASTTTMQASQPTTADGSIDLTVMGGTGEYSFLWSNTETTEDLENILPGTYTVTITDENECEIVETVSVTSPGGMSVIPTATQITCFGLDNGSISLEIEGGTMPFTILWSNDETTETISDLEPGVYTVTVTDDTGFSINTSAEITEPAEFNLTAIPTGVACNGDENGSINITTNNGQADFDFIWSNEATTQNISGLASGVYMVTATDDNGCVATQTATVSTPNPLVLTEDIIENPECWDDTNGTIFLSTTGGTGDYEYIWSNGDMTEDIINLSADTYLVTVTDENNCTAEMSYDVTAPLPILITLDETNITCGGATVGSITATVTGGTTASGDYDLTWSNSETTLTITDLTAGTYTLTAEDDNGCTSVESATITQTGSLVLSETQENISCFGEEDGLILVQVVGSGTAPFDYLWSDGQMTDLATGLAAQDYTVTVTDADGCEGIETYIISQPTPMIGTLDAIAASCFDSENGAIEVSVSGGTLDTGSDYAYSWSNSATTEDLEDLPAGEYTVTITDDNDCQLIETETVLSPDELVINAIQGGTDCGNTDNISITLEVTGGTPDYIYNWDNGATTAIVENLSEGTYMATVTDDNGCTQSIEQTVSQPTPIVADAFIQRAGCKTANDGLIDVTTMGGLAPYDFAWSNGSFEEDIMGLSAGNYTLTVTDATNCVHEMIFEIEVAPEPFSVNFLVNSGLSETDTLQVNSSDIVQFIDVSLPTPTAWEWSFGDPNNSTSTEQNPQFSYPFDEDMEQTEYMASLVASNEYCRDTITKTILIINNFRPNLPEFDPGENVRFLNVNAYPNPTDDVINLDIEMSKDTEVKVQIVDVLGRVHEERTLTDDDTYNAQFSMKNLANGVYYVHLSSADRKVTLGVVKVD